MYIKDWKTLGFYHYEVNQKIFIPRVMLNFLAEQRLLALSFSCKENLDPFSPFKVSQGASLLGTYQLRAEGEKLRFFGVPSGLDSISKWPLCSWLEMQLVVSLATVQSSTGKRIFFLLPSQPIILPFAFLLPLLLLPLLRVGEVTLCLVNRQHAASRVVWTLL